MEFFYAVYGLIRNLVLTYEPNSADEFEVLDKVFGYNP